MEMSISQIRLYDLFRKELNLPDDKAADFVLAVGDVVELDTKKEFLATKDDIHILKDDIHILKDDIHNLELKIEQSKGDIYKAMFLTGIVQLITMLGGVMAIVKFIR